MYKSSSRIFKPFLILTMILLIGGCMAPTTTASFSNDFAITYKSTNYSTFLGFLTGYLTQFNDVELPHLGSDSTLSHPEFSATEIILLNDEPVLEEHTFLSSIADPYNASSMVPFYERYQSYYPAYSPNGLTIAMILSREPITEYNGVVHFRLQDFTFYTGIDGLGNFNGQYSASDFWYNPIVENMLENVSNPSIVNPFNSTVVRNFQVVSQSGGSFEVTLDVVSWRLGYFDYNLTAAELIDQTDFTSTITLHFAFDAALDQLTLSYNPSTKFVLPFANDYVPTATDTVLVTMQYQIGTVDWTSFDHVKTFSTTELSGLLNQAWVSWGGLGTFLK
jgi:hypothetical protein